MFFIKNHLSVNSPIDIDDLKHNLPDSEEVHKYGASHVIYIYGDISKAVRSLFRREYTAYQYIKLRLRQTVPSSTNLLKLAKKETASYKEKIKNKTIEGISYSEYLDTALKTNVKEYIPSPFITLSDYVKVVEKTNNDPMGIVSHYNAWKAVPNVFFIHYESIPISEKIDEFLDLPKGTCAKFEITERKSTCDNSIESADYLQIMNRFSEYFLQINNILNNPTPGKCADRVCKFMLNSNPKNNNGKYCCSACKNERGHGPKCQRVTYIP
jgi:hypothetical protein